MSKKCEDEGASDAGNEELQKTAWRKTLLVLALLTTPAVAIAGLWIEHHLHKGV